MKNNQFKYIEKNVLFLELFKYDPIKKQLYSASRNFS